MTERIIGYVLLLCGVMTLVYTALNVTDVMSGKVKPVQPFNFSGISMNPSQFLGDSVPDAVKQQLSQGPGMQLVSPEMLNDTSNFAAHLVLMGFIATIGFRVGSLGIMLLRPITVPIRIKKEEQSVTTSG